MEEIEPWLGEFGVTEETLDEWRGQVPEGESLTFWALENGKIDSERYLDWAREHYGLPSLKKIFFERPVNFKTWEQLRKAFKWSRSIFPVGEWGGTVYLACIEPLQKTEWEFSVSYLLADIHSLNRYWEQLHQEDVPELAGSGKEASSLPSLETLQPPPPSVAASEELILEEHAAPEDSAAPEVSMPPLEISPETSPEMSLEISPETSPELSSEIPPFAFGESATPEDSAAPEVSMSSLEMPPEISPEMSPGLSSEIPPPAPEGEPAASEDATPEEGVIDPSIDLEALASLKHTVKADDTELQGLFNDLHEHFDSCMVLRVESETEISALFIDERWIVSEVKGEQKISIAEPNIFRIVLRSSYPFHGPIADNSFNREFFNRWGFKELPEHATVVPIISDGEVIALLLGVGRSSTNALKALSFAEQQAQKFVGFLNQTQSEVA